MTATTMMTLIAVGKAQTPLLPASKHLDLNQHGWLSYSGDHPVAGRWGVHFDMQKRRSGGVTEWQQYQIRPGLNYHAKPNLMLTLGYVFTRTYPYGDFPVARAFPEHRMYQQALIGRRRGTVSFQHRIRMEQRWIYYPSNQPAAGATYQNRFRYLVRAEIPLARRADKSVSWYLPVYDEILIGIPPNYGARPFDQNRVFAGVGYAWGKTKVDAGYLNQFLGQRNGRVFEMNNTFLVSISSTVSIAGLFAN